MTQAEPLGQPGRRRNRQAAAGGFPKAIALAFGFVAVSFVLIGQGIALLFRQIGRAFDGLASWVLHGSGGARPAPGTPRSDAGDLGAAWAVPGGPKQTTAKTPQAPAKKQAPAKRKSQWPRRLAIAGALVYAWIAMNSSRETYEGMILLAMVIMSGYVVVGTARRRGEAKAEKLRREAAIAEDERFDSAEALQAELTRPHSDDELAEAGRRIRALKKAANGLSDTALAPSLTRLAFVAEGLLIRAGTRPAARQQLRRPLVHHLEHVEAVTLNLFRMYEEGAADSALMAQAAATFDQLAADFEAHKLRASRSNALETEARLDLLAADIGMAAPPGAAGAARPEAR